MDLLKKIVFTLFFILAGFSTYGQETITIEVNWPNWSSQNRVILRNPAANQIGSVCNPSNCYVNNVGDSSYDNIASPTSFSGLTAGTGYSLVLEDSFGDGWNGSGAYVRVFQNGNLITQSTLSSGSSSTVSFNIVTANAPPVISATGNEEYCTATNIPVVQSISITDSDDTTAEAVAVQISSGYLNGEDVLTLTGTHSSITTTWSAVEGKLTLAGPATLTEFENAVAAIRYSSSSTNPTGSRNFSITVGDPNYLPSMDHYYEFVSSIGITWTAARDAAALRTYYGLQGYLATLTSQEEADFSGSQAQGTGWIGASDAAVEGDWRWVTGPEAGTSFWSGTSSGNTVGPTFFAYWNGGEPNQSGNEDYAHITDPSVVRGSGGPGSWNDLSNTGSGSGAYQPKGYIVEYGGSAGDPTINISASTSIQLDSEAPTWITVSGSLDETYQCASEIATVPSCTDLRTTYFNQAQYSWGFGLQNSTGTIVPEWEVRINNANYQLNPTQLSNQSAFTYTEVDNGNGTYNLILTGTSAIQAYSSIPGGNIEWSGVNFGFTPTSNGISIYCGSAAPTMPEATDNCAIASIDEVSNVTVNNGCANNYTQTISYQATDTNGNLSSLFVKTITVNDNTLPTASNPNDVTVYCRSDFPVPDSTVVDDESDNCTSNPVVTFISDSSDGLSNPETITRTYSVTDDCSNAINVTQQIKVYAVTINTAPTHQYAIIGDDAVFSVAATGGASGNLAYQWQQSIDNGATFTNISGATNSSYTVSNVSMADHKKQFRVSVYDSAHICTDEYSNEVILFVDEDTDADGILNILDFDDDNDGILDTDEGCGNLIMNPSFEQQDFTDPATFPNGFTDGSGTFIGATYNTNALAGWNYTTNLDGWVGGGSPSWTPDVYALAYHGNQYIDVTGNNDVTSGVNNTLSQIITTEIGKTYLFSFFWGEDIGHETGTQVTLDVDVIDSGNTHIIDETLNYTAEGLVQGIRGPQKWFYYEHSFVATTTETTIQFYATPDRTSNGAALDLVSVSSSTECLDSDNDGVPNVFDLDSDNDGIYDAVEAGHNQAHINGVVPGAVGTDGVPDNVQNNPNSEAVNYTLSDADLDVIPDVLEFDSDNDGCNDADEAFADPDADLDNNGMYGSGSPAVNSDGTVIAASYQEPADADNNSTYDFLEIGQSSTITSEPTNQTIFVNTPATFTVIANDANSYQWYESSDGGVLFLLLADTTKYSGSQTSTLTINTPTIADNGKLYRVIVTNNFACAIDRTSQQALLNIKAKTIITNRRITYRVKAN
ncbi:hypothetical protein [Cellulophaga sp. L1A9]|uniref:hypothetical protein n=1 Tax=Cellulophaga sp. L1A9 TaxID=2686362 RepID=UPI00131C4C6B|nr:hypothetical protein [Cellulophaga sp. L1A9]